MSFSDHIFYEHIIFDVNKKMYRSIAVKQGDTGSRGLFVKVIQNSTAIDISDMTMTFYCKKPDGTKVYIDAVKDGDKFRVDLTNQVSAVPGKVECELTLKGPDDEIISSKAFSITVEPSLQYGSMLSQSELSDFGRHLADYTAYIASELSEEHIPRALPNGVKDEIDLGTCKLIKRVSDEVFLDGSENWILQSINEYGIANFQLRNLNTTLPNATFEPPYEGKFTVSGFKLQSTLIAVTTEEGFLINSVPSFFIRILASKLSQQNVTGFKAWLQVNPITLNYQLAEPEIIDLPEVMTPNTRTLMHLIERLQKLEE